MIPQPLQAKLVWKTCADLPCAMSNGMSTIINGKVYYGGGECTTNDESDSHYTVFCYAPLQDNWTTLPPLPTELFGLGQISGKLVAVGGQSKPNSTPTNKVYTLNFNKRAQKWKQKISPMPAAKISPAVVSTTSALVVAGGKNIHGECIHAVDAFVHSSQLWFTCKCSALPKSCASPSAILIENNVFMMGGYQASDTSSKEFSSNLNQAFHATISDFLSDANVTSADTKVHHSSHSVWKTLPNTATYRPAASAILDNSLLAIGGNLSTSKASAAQKKVFAYSPTANSWIYVSDLPHPAASTTTAALSPTEILVIGGWDSQNIKTVVKGTLTHF